ncbi:MAG: phosphatidylserine/phosphatidylglycerophosphate/cardiolipin synthase family protein, partial [Deltaproteobacteria bacterium]|nr:phosphatidylserine/phosphatidylglycerophosphate/cardiolipin synthase family protein [Deltaproteobacteria bacterium]
DMASFAEPVKTPLATPRDLPAADRATEIRLTPQQLAELRLAQAWVRYRRDGVAPPVDGAFEKEFEPARARVITHRFFGHLATGAYGGEHRLEMPDEVVDAIAALVPKAREIRLSTLFVLFNPKLKAALKEGLANGARLSIHFNGDKTSRESMPLALSYKHSLEDVIELMKAGAVKVAVMDQARYRYLHKKLFVVDDHVFFGSHNFNLPSTISNSELVVEVDDPNFAEAMSLAYDHDFLFSGRPLTMKEAVADYDGSSVTRWLAKFVQGFF